MKIAALLAAVVAYLLLTDWIVDHWSYNLAYAAIFALAAATAVVLLKTPSQLRSAWTLAPLAAAPIWGLLQLAAHIPAYRFETWASVLKWTAAFALFWAALQAFSTLNSTSAFKNAIVAVGALVSLEATLFLVSGSNRIYGLFAAGSQTQPMGPFPNRDHFCALMELIIPLSLWSGLRDRRRAWIYFTATAAMYGAVIASASRAGAIIASLEVVLVIIASVSRKPESGKVGIAISAAIVIVIGGAIAGWSPLLERFEARDLFLYRRELFASTLRMIQDHPLFGAGLGSWPWLYPRYALIDVQAVANHAHSDWMEWASDGGIPFVAFMAAIAGRAFWLSLERPWGFGIVAVFIHAAVDFPLQRPPLLFALLLLLALLEVRGPRATAASR